MKKVYLFLSLIAVFAFIAVSCDRNDDISESIQNKSENVKEKCTTIQSGELVNSSGDLITVGYTDFGYNYQAHMYNGEYTPGWNLVMKWNDAWLSNQDCDGDGLLDRHLGYDTYIGSGAWLTNHWTTTYMDEFGNECVYDEFTKIIAVPEDATKTEGIWYNAEGIEIGPDIWGQFAIIQSVINDPCAGIEGLDFKSPDHPGLGNW